MQDVDTITLIFTSVVLALYNLEVDYNQPAVVRRAYDARFSLCCDGVVRSRSGISPACCGTGSYDARFYSSCGGVIRSSCGTTWGWGK